MHVHVPLHPVRTITLLWLFFHPKSHAWSIRPSTIHHGVPQTVRMYPSVSTDTTTTHRTTRTTLHSTSSTESNMRDTLDWTTQTRLPWSEQGYQSWKWRDRHDINYLEMGDKSKPALLLIHGFGASAYHFRYNIPELAKHYHVFAFDMLGFGLSSKPIQDYSAHVWKDQTIDFITQVIQKPTTVAGNSLGGFTALFAASQAGKELVPGCILLNAAGRFRDDSADEEEDKKNSKPENGLMTKVKEYIQRGIIWASFLYTKQPARIQQVLRQVYPVNPNMVDDELVRSIQVPSFDENAAEVFYRVIVKNGNGPAIYVDDLLQTLECPLLLLWGMNDPWIRPAAADKIRSLYPVNSVRFDVNAGHCPHDEAPFEVNSAIRTFMEEKIVACGI